MDSYAHLSFWLSKAATRMACNSATVVATNRVALLTVKKYHGRGYSIVRDGVGKNATMPSNVVTYNQELGRAPRKNERRKCGKCLYVLKARYSEDPSTAP